jgi:hypothetical protein
MRQELAADEEQQRQATDGNDDSPARELEGQLGHFVSVPGKLLRAGDVLGSNQRQLIETGPPAFLIRSNGRVNVSLVPAAGLWTIPMSATRAERRTETMMEEPVGVRVNPRTARGPKAAAASFKLVPERRSSELPRARLTASTT